MVVDDNNREFTRIPIKIKANLKFGGTTFTDVSTEDLSMKGIFVKTDETMPEGSKCEVLMELIGQSDPIKLDMKGIVERETDAGMGIKFTEIDLDSYSHLKNLVLLNAATSNIDGVESEIGDHIGINKRI